MLNNKRSYTQMFILLDHGLSLHNFTSVILFILKCIHICVNIGAIVVVIVS